MLLGMHLWQGLCPDWDDGRVGVVLWSGWGGAAGLTLGELITYCSLTTSVLSAQCPVRSAQCPVRSAQCPVPSLVTAPVLHSCAVPCLPRFLVLSMSIHASANNTSLN